MVFVFTEMIRCGRIGRIALQTYHMYHSHPVHVFGRAQDLDELDDHPNTIRHDLPDDNPVTQAFDKGHLGTSMLWAKVIRSVSDEEIVHFDSDVIFRGDIVNDVIAKLDEGYDLVGGSRNYKHNPHGPSQDHVRHLPDTVATYCFGFRKSKVNYQQYDYTQLQKMCEGSYMPFSHGHIDFFDPVSFAILHNGGRVFYLDSDIVGGCNPEGSRLNKYGELNTLLDIGDKLSHFSSVGSGLNFYTMQQQGKQNSVPSSYVLFALKKFDLYMRVFYETSILQDEENEDNLKFLPELLTLFERTPS
jgi:hypothetical protein